MRRMAAPTNCHMCVEKLIHSRPRAGSGVSNAYYATDYAKLNSACMPNGLCGCFILREMEGDEVTTSDSRSSLESTKEGRTAQLLSLSGAIGSPAPVSISGKGRLAIGGRSGIAVTYEYEVGRKVGSFVGTVRGSLNRFDRGTFNSPMILTCSDRLQFEILVTSFSSQCATFLGVPIFDQWINPENIKYKKLS
jgi:hypothetical protein